MERFLYKLLKWLITEENVELGYYSIFNNQITDDSKDEGINFPAILLEPGVIENTYLPNDVLKGYLEFNVHIYTEFYQVIRDNDSDEDTALKHFDIINDVVRAIEGHTTDQEVERPYNLTDDQNMYILGRVELISKEYLPREKSIQHSVLRFTCPYVSLELWNNENLDELTIISVSGDTITNNTGSTYNLGVE